MIQLIILLILYVLFDELQQHSEQSKWKPKLPSPKSVWNDTILLWLNKKTSWKNKHKWKPTWLYSTALVSLTDGEHFFQLLKHICLAIIIGLQFEYVLIATLLTMVVIGIISYIVNDIILK